ncbi:ATP-dependent zinc metalloprotease FtsH [Candidatus Weimeria sp. HCP3S3_B5]|uniref:ATP-dependent zinc metalloprotease FtsH n=1 Tax=Candidatus Weimeria sp. HCP3S3_B5 TaxID=3438871 RepID=UPI003F8C6CF9
MEQKRRGFGGLWFYLILIVVVMGFWLMLTSHRSPNYSLSQLETAIDNDRVSSISIHQNREVPTGEVDVKLKQDRTSYYFYVSDVKEIEKELASRNVSYSLGDVPQDSWVGELLPMLVITAMIFILFTVMFNGRAAQVGSQNSKMTNFGKSRAQMITRENVKVRFKDVAGLAEEKKELEEVVDFLKAPDKYTHMGARIPKGMLLVGPPGTGKTLLAKAVAGEAGVPFFSISGSDFVEMFVGVGAARVRDLFTDAKKNSPCIVFIDEIDAVARRRGSGMGGGHDEREQTLNQMLVEMDGFEENEGIIVMAATNREDILDPALTRPGRFDRRIYVGRPDIRGREEILKVHAANKPLADDVDLHNIAQTTVGFSGADLENLLNEAAILAAKNSRSYITERDIKDSFVKVSVGTEKKSRVITDEEKRITAYHESGHAILMHLLPKAGPVNWISIIPTGPAGGYTMPLNEKDNMYETRGRMLDDIIVDFGGRVAEELIFDDITTGASNDIKQATKTARDMVTVYGFSSDIGPINYQNGDPEEIFLGRDLGHARPYGEAIATSIDEEVKHIIDKCYAKARKIISEHRDVLDKSAALLIEKEKISREEFEALFEE